MAASPSDDLAKALGDMADEEAGSPQTPAPPPAAAPKSARSPRPDAPVPSPVRPATPTHTPDDEEIEGVLEDDEAEDEASPKLHVQAPPRRVQQQTQQILDARPVNRQPPPASPPEAAPASDDPMAQAAAAAAAPRRTPVRPGAKKKKSSDLSATAAPILLTVGLLLMVPAVWAVMILRGYENAWGADRPNAGMMAKLMLSAWPMGLILIGSGIYCFIKAFKAPRK